MIKIVGIIVVLVIFWALFGKYVMNLLSFVIKIGIKTFLVIMGILLILAALSSNAQEIMTEMPKFNQIDTSYVQVLQQKVDESQTESKINYDGFWSDRTPKSRINETNTSVNAHSSDSIKIKAKEVYNDFRNLCDSFVETETYKDAEKEVVKTTEKVVKTIGKISATIYYNGKNYFKVGSDWFNEGWEKVENEQKIKELNKQ